MKQLIFYSNFYKIKLLCLITIYFLSVKVNAQNTLFGTNSGFSLISGNGNTFIGYNNGYSTTSGNNNTFLGDNAGHSNITGSGNVFIGYQSGYNLLGSNRLNISNNSTGSLIHGDFTNNWVGIDFTLGLRDQSSGNYTFLQSSQLSGSDITFTLPSSGGTSGYVLSTSGGSNATLSWIPQNTGTITRVGSMTTEEVFFDNNAIGEWLGMGASNGRIEFNVSGSDEYILLKDANVGIGTSTPGNALDVYDTGTAINGTGYFEETFSGSNSWFAYAIRGITEFTGNPNHYSIGTGLNGDARYAQENFGVKGYAAADDNNIWSIGVYGEASDIYGAPSAQIIGVKGLAGYTAQNYGSLIGVYAESQGYNATDYGIFATGMKQIGQYTIFSDGDTWSLAYWSPSDKKFKKDIKPIANSLDIINKITPHTYYFKTEDFPMHKFSSNVQYGFIAQELETILPSLVKESVYPELRDEKGNVIREKVNFKAVNYDQLIPILTQGIKEQQLMIENMQKEIQLLKQNIELFENNSQLNDLAP